MDSRFVRIHRAYIVNADHVTGIAPMQVSLGARQLEVSRKYKETVAIRFDGKRVLADAE